MRFVGGAFIWIFDEASPNKSPTPRDFSRVSTEFCYFEYFPGLLGSRPALRSSQAFGPRPCRGLRPGQIFRLRPVKVGGPSPRRDLCLATVLKLRPVEALPRLGLAVLGLKPSRGLPRILEFLVF